MRTRKTDAQIQEDLIRELARNPRVEETDVGVEVEGGIVTLTGTVDSWGKKYAAQEAAHQVPGVLDVANDIVVHVPGTGKRTDTELAQAVRAALERDAFVPDWKIQCTVSDGGVTLAGTVEYYSQRSDAERAIRDLEGVRWIANRIEISTPQVAPAEVRRAIEIALARHAERAANRIHLEVHDGKVTLSGPVRSWVERRAIVGAATAMPGVIDVEDRIEVQP